MEYVEVGSLEVSLEFIRGRDLVVVDQHLSWVDIPKQDLIPLVKHILSVVDYDKEALIEHIQKDIRGQSITENEEEG